MNTADSVEIVGLQRLKWCKRVAHSIVIAETVEEVMVVVRLELIEQWSAGGGCAGGRSRFSVIARKPV